MTRSIHDSHARTLCTLGTMGMLASPMMLVEGIRFRFGQSEMDVWTGLGGVVYMLGALASVVGLRLVRASGNGRIATGLFATQVALLAAAMYWSATYVVGGTLVHGTIVSRVTDVAWPLSHLSMLVLGTLMIRARRLEGWRRLPALAIGVALPTFIALSMLGLPRPLAASSFGVLTTLGYLGLGWVVRTSGGESTAVEPSVATT